MGYLAAGRLARSGTGLLEVTSVTIDSLSGRLGAARILFIDVEGAEPLVLRGASAYIAEHRPALVVEAAAHQLKRAGFSVADLHAEVTGRSYRVFRVPQGRLSLEPAPAGNPGKQCNWLCVHETRLAEVEQARRSLFWCGVMPCVARLNPLRRERSSGLQWPC